MSEVEDFLAAALPPLRAADKALHDGDPAPRIALWSRHDPVTVFGALLNAEGWGEVEPLFERLGERFSNCESFEYEVVAAGASGDLGYIAGFERTVASVAGGPPKPYQLRVTTIFRREQGEWRVVHRHADPVPDGGAREQLSRLRDG